jgi:hypothetical protein
MNKGVLISLTLAVFLIYNFVANGEPSGEEGGSALEKMALNFLEMAGGRSQVLSEWKQYPH